MSLSTAKKIATIRKQLKQNDTKARYYFVAHNQQDNSIIDLTGCTAKFQMKLFGGTSLQIDSAMVINDPTNGKLYYQMDGTDLDTAGTFEAEIEITFPDSRVMRSVDRLIIVVTPEVS